MRKRVVRTLMVGVMIVGLGALLQYSPVVFAKNLPPPRESAAGGAVGRYQIVISPHVRADTFLLDTATGRVWINTQFSDLKGEPTVWQVMDRVDSIKELVDWIQLFERKPPEPRGSGNKVLKTP